MDLLANDLSIHEQFHDFVSFRNALFQLVAMRAVARRFGSELYCHRTFLSVRPIPGMSMQKAVGKIDVESKRRSVMSWLTSAGPFWDDLRQHGADDYFECLKNIVTDTAVGEAAFRVLHGVECGLISVVQSNWKYTPVEVVWRRGAEGLPDRLAAIDNWWNAETLTDALRSRVEPVQSWFELREASISRFENLIFSDSCFAPLEGIPFGSGAAKRFLVLLDVLNKLAMNFEAAGRWTTEGQQLYQDYFTGDRALFSDSSESEKQKFRRELTFTHPEEPQESLFCTWHGKVSQMTLRLHFSWPIEANKPVYVVYVGPKITKR